MKLPLPSSRWRWLPPGLMAIAIFIVSSIPGQSLPHSPALGFDKLVHATEYAILGALAAYALTCGALTCESISCGSSWKESWLGPASSIRRVILVWLAASVFGITDEIHQHFVAGRFADQLDALADSAGAFLGVTFVFIGMFVVGKKNA